MKNRGNVARKNVGYILLAIVTVITMICYLAWRLIFTLPGVDEYGWFAFILGLLLWTAELFSAVEAFVHCTDVITKMEPEMPTIPEEWYPDVDVFIATHNESEDILFKTANGCTYMKYPDKSKVHIYFCDDGNRPSVKALADRLGIGYIGLANNKEAKAGNLNNAISKTSSPLIATFDADMIPTSEFLMETVPYFFLPKMKKDEDGKWIPKEEDEIDEDEKIGFIQSPQSFYNPDLFQYNLYSENRVPNEQDYFFRQVNVGRNSSNSPIYAGSNTVISREALNEVGGICTGTITEDFETGLLIESKGYQCYAVDKTLAKGLAPTTIGSLIKQRERWARGCIFSMRRHHVVLNPKIPLKIKASYMACRSYWDSFLRRFIYILSPILFVLLGIPAVVCDVKELLFIWLPTYVLYSVTLKVTSGNIRNTRLSNVIDTIMFPYLMVPILAEVFHIHKQEFVVTDKNRQQSGDKDKLLALPHAILFVFSMISLVLSVRDLLLYGAVGAVVVIYWLFVNSTSLLLAIFFMLGRKNSRNSERFFGRIPVTITIDDLPYHVYTEDFSEGGMSVAFPIAVYISENEEVEAEVTDKGYTANMKLKIASVSRLKTGGHKYCFAITEIDEANKKEYYQIVYDRNHSLPTTISRKSSVYGDISSNIKERISKADISTRKHVRMEINRKYPLTTGEMVYLKNYNFNYVLLIEEVMLEDEIEIIVEKNIIMKCHRYKSSLFKVDNVEELTDNPEFMKIIEKWDKNE